MIAAAAPAVLVLPAHSTAREMVVRELRYRIMFVQSELGPDALLVINGPCELYRTNNGGVAVLSYLLGFESYDEYRVVFQAVGIIRQGSSMAVGWQLVLDLPLSISGNKEGTLDGGRKQLQFAAISPTAPGDTPLYSMGVHAGLGRDVPFYAALRARVCAARTPPGLGDVLPPPGTEADDYDVPGEDVQARERLGAERAIAELLERPNFLESRDGTDFFTLSPVALGHGHSVSAVYVRIVQSNETARSPSTLRRRRQSAETTAALGNVDSQELLASLASHQLGPRAAARLVAGEISGGTMFSLVVSVRVALEVSSWNGYQRVCVILRDAYGRLVLVSLARVRAFLGQRVPEYVYWFYETKTSEDLAISHGCYYVKDHDEQVLQTARSIFESGRYVERRVGPLKSDGSRDFSYPLVYSICQCANSFRGGGSQHMHSLIYR